MYEIRSWLRLRQTRPPVRHARPSCAQMIQGPSPGARPYLLQTRLGLPGTRLRLRQARPGLRQGRPRLLQIRPSEIGVEEGGDKGRVFHGVLAEREQVIVEGAGGGRSGASRGGGPGGVRQGFRFYEFGLEERDRTMATDDAAEEASGFAVGDAGDPVFEQGEEDAIGFDGEVGGIDPGKIPAEAGPAGNAGDAPGLGGGRTSAEGFRAVVAAEFVAAGGGAAALLAVGEDMDAFGCHGTLRDELVCGSLVTRLADDAV